MIHPRAGASMVCAFLTGTYSVRRTVSLHRADGKQEFCSFRVTTLAASPDIYSHKVKSMSVKVYELKCSS